MRDDSDESQQEAQEQNSEVAAILQGMEAEARQGREQAQQVEVVSLADEVFDSLVLVRDAGEGMAPAWLVDYAATFSDKRLKAIAKAAAKLMQRYGWDMRSALEWLGPWAGLAIALAEPLGDVVSQYRAHKAQGAADGSQGKT